jgi:hypothetical protein
MKVNLSITTKRQELKRIKMESITALMNLDAGAALESSFGVMEKHMKENGVWEKRMAMEFGDLPRETIMKANGKKIFKVGRDVTIIKDARCIGDTLKTH